MTIITNWYTMDSKLGVNLNQVISWTGSTDFQSIEFPTPMNLLDRVQGNMGSEWVLVQASTTVSAGMCVVIDNKGNANDITSALAVSGVYAYGIANFQSSVANGILSGGAANTGDWFWAVLKANGGVAVNVSPSVGRGVAMYVSAVPGAFTSSVTGNQVHGIELVASIGTSASGPGEAVIRTYMTFGTAQ